MAEFNTELTPDDASSLGNSAMVKLVQETEEDSSCQQWSWPVVAVWTGIVYILVVFTETLYGAAWVSGLPVTQGLQLTLLVVLALEQCRTPSNLSLKLTDWILVTTSAMQVTMELMGYTGFVLLKLAVVFKVLTANCNFRLTMKKHQQALQQVSDQLQVILKLPETQRQRKIHTKLTTCIEALSVLAKSNHVLSMHKSRISPSQSGFNFFENELDAKEFAVFSEVGSMDFNIFTLKNLTHSRPLHAIGGYLLIHRGLCSSLQISSDKMNSLLVALENGYNPLPYHSSTHAADVMQAVHAFVKSELTSMEEMVLYVAAAAHDVGHPGRNNAFLVNTKDPLAVLYNDKSVLENHHLATLFSLINDEKHSIFSRFSPSDYKQTRSALIEMILSTDISDHSRLLTSIQSSPLPASQPRSLRSLHLSFLLHAGDISNPARRWPLAHAWTQLILEECFEQGDEERDLGLSVGPLNDRNLEVSKCQIGFIEHLVAPTFARLGEMLPSTRPLQEVLERNKEAWKLKT